MSGQPSYIYRPSNFVPSSLLCELFPADDMRSRVIAGGVLFRSKATGRATNFITVQSTLLASTYTVTIVEKDPQTLAVIKTLIYTGVEIPIDPLIDPLATSTAVADIRAAALADVNNDVIELPTTDAVFDTYTDPVSFDIFSSTSLVNGDGLPLPYDPVFLTIHTGPERTMGFIRRLDLGSSFTNIYTPKEWNGSTWVTYVPFT